MQIAVYGKGGIGKSTISANLSAALAAQGCRVLQIGCDPKHDSTRLLHHGQKVQTILDYLLHTPPDAQKPEDILMEGYRGTGCVEAGGPRPGMGCAGRGILTAFDFLDRFAIGKRYDHVVYDVLGDVVCGGFAVPVRKQYANAVFLVTSGESMAIYAANNILHGIQNLDPNGSRVAGIICNGRGLREEANRVEAFAKAVGLPVLMKIPRSELFAAAERKAVTVVEDLPDSPEAQLFLSLASQIRSGIRLFAAKPLSEEQMERFMRGDAPRALPTTDGAKQAAAPAPAPARSVSTPAAPKKRALKDPFSRVPLFGCAYRGAVDLAVHVKDAVVLGHAPKSCTWYAIQGITGYARRGLFERGVLYPAFVPRNLENTDITVEDAVFGGVEHFRKKAMALAAQGVRTIIAVTACIPGMSGDDLAPVQKELEGLGCNMYIVHTDGVEAGDYNEGMALCYKTLAQEAIFPHVEPDPDSINLVYEHTISSQTDRNYTELEEILGEMGIRVNCRFLCATSIEDIHNFLKAPYSVLARSDRLGLELRELFEKQYGCRFLDGALPRGFAETAHWVRQIGRLYGRERQAEAVIQRRRPRYLEKIQALKPAFRGKKAVIFLERRNADWVLELAEDLEWNVVKTILLGAKDDSNPGWNRRFSAEWSADRQGLEQAISEHHPDFVVINDFSALASIPPSLNVINVLRDSGCGFFAGTDSAESWSKLLENSIEGRWKCDKPLFEEYYR